MFSILSLAEKIEGFAEGTGLIVSLNATTFPNHLITNYSIQHPYFASSFWAMTGAIFQMQILPVLSPPWPPVANLTM